MKLSLIVPAYNEEKTIITILEQVKANRVPGVEFETIVVDDASKDQTVKLLKERPDLYSKLICQPKNGGKGAAVKAGLLEASGEYVLFQDADLEYDPSEYHKLIEPAVKYNADIVMGSRILAPSCRRVHYFWNKMGNGLITLVFNILFNKTFTDIYTCYLMFRREYIDPNALRTMGFDQQAEILAKCVKKGKIFYEVPITYHGRTYEEGKKIRTHHVVSVLFAMIRERLSRERSESASRKKQARALM